MKPSTSVGPSISLGGVPFWRTYALVEEQYELGLIMVATVELFVERRKLCLCKLEYTMLDWVLVVEKSQLLDSNGGVTMVVSLLAQELWIMELLPPRGGTSCAH